MKSLKFQYLVALSTLALQGLAVNAQDTLSSAGKEIEFEYSTSILTTSQSIETAARNHFRYLFGVFEASEFILEQEEKFDVSGSRLNAMGSPLLPINVVIQSVRAQSSNSILKYTASGKMIIAKEFAEAWLKQGFVDILLPYDVDKVESMEQTCGNKDFMGDFWDSYNPYTDNKNCTVLATPEYSQLVRFKITADESKKNPKLHDHPFKKVLGNNGNGEDLNIYYITDFMKKPSRDDIAAVNFFEIIEHLKNEHAFLVETQKGRVVDANHRLTMLARMSSPLNSNEFINVRLKTLLTKAKLTNKQYLRFYKEALEQGDIIIYAGHDGFGTRTNLKKIADSLVNKPKHPENKHQIFWFDACRTYPFYMDMYQSLAPGSSASIIVNATTVTSGATSYVHSYFFDALFSGEAELTWKSLLDNMEERITYADDEESALEGDTGLFSVKP